MPLSLLRARGNSIYFKIYDNGCHALAWHRQLAIKRFAPLHLSIITNGIVCDSDLGSKISINSQQLSKKRYLLKRYLV